MADFINPISGKNCITKEKNMTLPEEFIAKKIYLIRDQKVMIDSDLSEMY